MHLPDDEVKYDFNDVLIQPITLSTIRSRTTTKPFDSEGYLPLFTAPMSSVVDDTNYETFRKAGIRVCLPRTVGLDRIPYNGSSTFASFGLKEFEDNFVTRNVTGLTHVLIDVANGHMADVLDIATRAKEKFPFLKIMAGNIASPDTYHEYATAKLFDQPVIDYVRVGIGNGNGCLTTEQTGVGYPMGSLINLCALIKDSYKHSTAIVADGGMKKYADIIKALALGADYVMVGSIFNKALESASPLYWKGVKMNNGLGRWMYENGFKMNKQFYGMSTKKAQQLMGNTQIKTSEGVVRTFDVEYTLQQWVNNFEHYYRSALSYTGAKDLTEFHKMARFNIVTQNAFLRYNK